MKTFVASCIFMSGLFAVSVAAQSLPQGWSAEDVGGSVPSGVSSYDEASRQFDVRGGGRDIWDYADQFHFAYRVWDGDGEWSVRVDSVEQVNEWTKAGIMVRETLAAGSRHAMIVLTPSKGVAFQRRRVTDQGMVHTGRAGVAPGWIKLVRRGDQFDTYTSADGQAWVYWATDRVQMPARVLVGLAVTSHRPGTGANAVMGDFVGANPSPGSFPSGWASRDIGSPALAGGSDYMAATGVTKVRGAGADVWNNSDQFHYVSQTWTGDVVAVVRVDSLIGTNSWAKAGLMIRAGTGPEAAHVSLVATPGNGVAFQRRRGNGGSSYNTARAGITTPVWLKLQRAGDRFYAFYSADGLSWNYLGSDQVSLPAGVQLGLAVTSHNPNQVTEAGFSHLGLQAHTRPGGLWGEYFTGRSLAGTAVRQRLDGMVDFNWGGAAPDPAVPADGFAVRWTGTLTPDVTQEYTLSTVTDDGVRLWIDGQLVIDDWVLHAPRETQAKRTLTAGRAYAVKMEYFENLGGASASLLWAAADRGRAPIPAPYLTPSRYPDADADGLPDYWENLHGLNPTDPADAVRLDPRSDGLTYLQVYLIEANPGAPDADLDGIPDLADLYPQDYYNGKTPLLTIVGGDNQSAAAGTVNPAPFDVAVWRPDGTGPLVLAPVDFTVAAGGGLLAPASLEATPPAASLQVRTDDEGTAQAYYQQPPAGGIRSRIVVTAGPAQVAFVSTSFTPGPYVTAGGDQSLWVDAAGVARSWGDNARGQLGDGGVGSRAQPARLPTLTLPIKAIAYGEHHGLAVSTSGLVYSWGDNAFGQVGDGTTVQRRTPALLPELTGVTQVAAGDHHSLALRSDGTVWSWGGNAAGQLGEGSVTSRLTPAQVAGLPVITHIAAGARHSAALAADGTVWVWGSNEFGQLAGAEQALRPTPAAVADLAGVTLLASGREHLLALKANGEVWVWGGNLAGQLGLGHNRTQVVPQRIPGLPAIKALTAGAAHSVALAADGTLWSWGDNTWGQLGDGTRVKRTAPVALSPGSIRAIAAGRDHTIVLRQDGTLQAWGLNASGQLGSATPESSSPVPLPVAAPID